MPTLRSDSGELREILSRSRSITPRRPTNRGLVRSTAAGLITGTLLANPQRAYNLGRSLYQVGKAAYRMTKSSKATTGNIKSNQNISRPLRKKSRPSRVRKPTVKKLAKAVHKLKLVTESDQGELIYRSRQVDNLVSSVNSQNWLGTPVFNTTFLETVLAQLRYYNPSTPGTLTTADGTTGTFMKDFLFEKMYVSYMVRNNYQVPAKVKIHLCKAKVDTSIPPNTAYTQGLTDVGAPSSSSPLVYLTDSQQFVDLWKIVSTESATLQPGEELTLTHTTPSFQYDPSLVDSHNQVYQKAYHGMAVFLRLEGVLGHDVSLDVQGTLQAGVDVQMNRTVIVKYSAGADIKTIVVNDESGTFTNAAVVSQKPVADNLSYSQS